MQKKDFRIKVLLLVFLLVFVGALYIVIRGISSNMSNESANNPASQDSTEAMNEGQAPMGDIETSISGAITELTGESITVKEPERTVLMTGPTSDLNTSVTMQNSITAKITPNTQYVNVTREELKVGDKVSLGAKEMETEPISYEAISVAKATDTPEATMQEADPTKSMTSSESAEPESMPIIKSLEESAKASTTQAPATAMPLSVAPTLEQ